MTDLEQQLAKAKTDAEKEQLCLDAVKESEFVPKSRHLWKYIWNMFKTSKQEKGV